MLNPLLTAKPTELYYIATIFNHLIYFFEKISSMRSVMTVTSTVTTRVPGDYAVPNYPGEYPALGEGELIL